MRLLCLLLLFPALYGICDSRKADLDLLHQQAYKLLEDNPDSAFALGVIAERKAVAYGLELEEAKSLFIQAYIYRQKEELGKAFILYLRALELLRPLKGEEARVNYTKILLNTGSILEYHYAFPQAIQYYNEGIHVAKEQGFSNLLVMLLNSKAMSLKHNKQLDEALIVIKQGIELAKAENNEEMLLSSINQQGLILKDMGQYAKARASYRQMIDFEYDKMPSAKYRGQAWHNTAVTYLEEERYQEAKMAYLNAVQENQTRQGSREEFITWMDLAETYYLLGEEGQAYETAKIALTFYDRMLLLPDHYALFNLLSDITHELGEYELSKTYSAQFVEENKSFLKAQRDLLQVKDQYKMEILTAGFFQELELSRTTEQYEMMVTILGISVIFFIALFAYEKIKQYEVRRSIKGAILELERESDI